jgi:predicted acyltransferase
MSLQAKNGETPNVVDDSGRVQMAQSNVVVTQGSGLAPNTEFAVYLFSTPTLLGIGRTNDKGEFFVSFAVENKMPLGDHTLQVNGLLPDGRTSSVSIPVRVVDKAVAAASEEAPPVESPATDIFAIFGLALLVLGLRWFWPAIRRREIEQE